MFTAQLHCRGSIMIEGPLHFSELENKFKIKGYLGVMVTTVFSTAMHHCD